MSNPTLHRTNYESIAELYDHVAEYAGRQDVQFFVDMARETGGPVLEVGCGTGRVLIPTARAGFEIMGLDVSPAMLAQCRRKVANEPVAVRQRVELVEADMRQFDLGRRFALITTPFRGFQHALTVEDQFTCLASLRRHLADDGRLVLDIFNPSMTFLTRDNVGVEEMDGTPFTMPDGCQVVSGQRILVRDYCTQTQDGELIYDLTHLDGRCERRILSFRLRYTFRFEAEHLLARAGFAIEALYADYDKKPYGSIYPGELIFVARKAD